MKVIRNEEFENPVKQPADPKEIAALREKFDKLQETLQTKKYPIYLDEEQTDAFFSDFFECVEWKGYESYAIAETYDRLNILVNEDKLNGETEPEIVEAVFHFLKGYSSSGWRGARLFKSICDQFSLPMKEINEDRQELRDISLELVALEQGISVEQLNKNLQSESMNG
jgi:hypothetical protein